jgi:hypothetical protein
MAIAGARAGHLRSMELCSSSSTEKILMRLRHGLFGTCIAIVLLVSGCPSGDDDDDDGSNGNGGAGTSGGPQAGNGGDSGNGSAATCDEQGCLACFNASTSEGADCMAACKGCDDDSGDDNGGGSGGSGSDTGGKQPDCTMDHDCGISLECVACGLTDTQGFCEFTKPCKFDEDCGVDQKCGYNVVSSEYRCLPASDCR